jgi:hypothetical protein
MEQFARFRPELDHGREIVTAEYYNVWLENVSKNLGNYELQL